MTAATRTVNIEGALEKLVRGLPVATGETTLPVKGFLNYAGVTTSDPADLTGAAGCSGLAVCTVTCTGVAAGDIVVGYGVVSGLATDSYVVGCYVSGTNTVSFVIGNKVNTSVTTTALVANVLVADVT